MKTILTIITLLITAQSVTVDFISSKEINGPEIPRCGNIDFYDQSIYSLEFVVRITKPTGYFSDGVVKIYIQHSGSTIELVQTTEPVCNNAWQFVPGNTNKQFQEFTLGTVSLDEANFLTPDGQLGVYYEDFYNNFEIEHTLCNYNIVKDALPSFTINPASLSLACGDATPRTFTVNDNNPRGTIEYVWNVGGGWSYLGFVRTNFTTTTKTV